MSDFKNDKKWADTFIPQIEKVVKSVAPNLLAVTVAPDYADMRQATDYVITIAPAGESIGCRIRTSVSFLKTFRDVTFRSSRPSGQMTEVEKIIGGYPAWYLYGWASGNNLDHWVFIDMDRVRWSGLVEMAMKHQIRNKDNSSQFVGVAISDLVANRCIIKQSRAFKETLAPKREAAPQIPTVQGRLRGWGVSA